MKTSELTGAALDWAVASAEGHDMDYFQVVDAYMPSTDWDQGGPILERERITLKPEWDGESEFWTAISITRFEHYRAVQSGPTPLIAAMRCYCCSKLGDDIDIPEELCRQVNS